MLSVSDIIKIESPKELFGSEDEVEVKAEYKRLIKKYHPDVYAHKEIANKVSIHINNLYLQFQSSKVDLSNNKISIKLVDDSTLVIKALARFDFELGETIIAANSIFYLIEKKHKALYENYKASVSSLEYMTSKMKEEFSGLMPKIEKELESESHYILIVSKPQDVYPLSYVVKALGGKLEHKHIAWVMSRLHNILCFFWFNNLTHNAISMDNLFISPSMHTVLPLGGWWYAKEKGDTLKYLPKSSFEVLTQEMKDKKQANYSLDFYAMQRLCRQLAGDVTGSSLLMNKEIPTPFKEWMISALYKHPHGNFVHWENVLDASYGERRFIHMNVDVKAVYSDKGV